MIKEIKTIEDVQSLIKQGFDDWASLGDVNTVRQGDLILFNYTAKAQYENRWNPFELMSRGLILNSKTAEIVARPFDKFFNYGEGDRYPTGDIVSVTEKVDGSLGIAYVDPCDDSIKIATRGSFDSDQAKFATAWLQEHLRHTKLIKWPLGKTLLFEIIYPDNRIVVDYGGKEGLVLLAARGRWTDKYMSHSELRQAGEQLNGIEVVKQVDYLVDELVQKREEIGLDQEGWVAEFSDGSRFKFKGVEYLRLHKVISSLTFKNTLYAHRDGTLNEVFEIVPDEFLEEVRCWVKEIEDCIEGTKREVAKVFSIAPKENRKEFALWVKDTSPNLAPYMFAALDGRDITEIIYKKEFVDQLKHPPT